MENDVSRVHISVMAKPASEPTTIVRLKNGDEVEVRGYGALKGRLKLEPGLDLTKPIYEQVIRRRPVKAVAP